MKPSSFSPSSHESGLLWRYFSPEEQAALKSLPVFDLTPERDLLFAAWSDRFASANSTSLDHTLAQEDLVTALHVALALGMLQRLHFRQRGPRSRWESVIREAYTTARADLGVPTYLGSSVEFTRP